jgi:hypothetical protein
VETENLQDQRPDEVAGFGNMNINYSQPNELTQDVGLLPATAMASPLPTDTSMTKSKESSFQIAEFAINHPILAMLVLGLIALIGSVCIFTLPIGWLPF